MVRSRVATAACLPSSCAAPLIRATAAARGCLSAATVPAAVDYLCLQLVPFGRDWTRGDLLPREIRPRTQQRWALPVRTRLPISAEITTLGKASARNNTCGPALVRCCFPPCVLLSRLSNSPRNSARSAPHRIKIMPKGSEEAEVSEELAAALQQAPRWLVVATFGEDVAAGRATIPAV